METLRFWLRYNLRKDGSLVHDGFKTLPEANQHAKKLRAQGYSPVFDLALERKSCVKIAMEYMNENKSFRNFENEQNISGVDSPSIWSEAAERLKKLDKC